MSLLLHIGNKNYSSWSLRPWVLMRTLDIPFTEHLTPFAGDGAKSQFTAFSPTGKVPCLMDGTIVVWDSLAIVEYLAERFPAVWPGNPTSRAWGRAAAAEMHSGFSTLRSSCTMNCGVRVRLASCPDALRADVARIDALWTEGLAKFGGSFLAGETFTAVDAFYAPVAFRTQTYDLPLGELSQAYAQRLLSLPAMQHWYADALQEPWRVSLHENATHAAGEVLRDDRMGI
jgi:glutathione S-transferase